MPLTYKIDKENRLVMTTAWGSLSFTDAFAHKDKLLNDPDFDPTYSQIADFTQITELALSNDELRVFAEFKVFSPQSRRAFITPRDLEYGMARMFATLRELRGEEGIGVFRTLEEALDWVLAKSA
jgi:pheromone shutdown protein TraB